MLALEQGNETARRIVESVHDRFTVLELARGEMARQGLERFAKECGLTRDGA